MLCTHDSDSPQVMATRAGFNSDATGDFPDISLPPAKMTTADPPLPPAELVKKSKGNYFIYGYKFTRDECPSYSDHIPNTDTQKMPHESMVIEAGKFLDMDVFPEVLVVSEPSIVQKFYENGGSAPHGRVDFPHFIIYAKYITPCLRKNVDKPRMQNCVAGADPEKLAKFEDAFGIRGKTPMWYATETFSRCTANVLSYSFTAVMRINLMTCEGIYRLTPPSPMLPVGSPDRSVLLSAISIPRICLTKLRRWEVYHPSCANV